MTTGQTIAPLDDRFALMGGGPHGSIGKWPSWVLCLLACAAIVFGLFAATTEAGAFPFSPEADVGGIYNCDRRLPGCRGRDRSRQRLHVAGARRRRIRRSRSIPVPEGGLFISTGYAISVLIALVIGVAMTFVARRTRDPATRITRDTLSGLGICLVRRFEQTGNAADLDAAIAAAQEAVDLTRPGHPDYPRYLSGLGICLVRRFEQTGNAADLDAAIAAAQEAVDLTRPGHPRYAIFLANLGAAHTATRFEQAGNAADLDAAVAAAQEAVDLTRPGHPNRATYLSGLANLLEARFRQAGNANRPG